MSLHHIEQIISGNGDRVSLYIRWNDARLIVYLDPSPSASSSTVENVFIERYNAASEIDDIEEAETLSDELLDTIVQVGRPVFDDLAPPSAPRDPQANDLHTLLFPKEHIFCFRTLNGKVEVVRDNDQARDHNVLLGRSGQPFHLNTAKGFNLPRFSTKEAHILRDILNSGYIARVSIQNREMCSKTRDTKGEDAAQRELDSLWNLSTSPLANSLRVPKLLGLIHMPNTHSIIGFLEEYVPVSEGWELSTLGRIETMATN